MPSVPEAVRVRRRRFQLFVLGLVGALVVFLSMLAPDLLRLVPHPVRDHGFGLTLIGLASAYLVAREYARRATSGGSDRAALSRRLARVDTWAAVGLSGGLSIAMALACVAFLATWLPHYLLWPWARDADTFATLAQSWDAGILPYRDIRGYNFPGAIYLHWILGKIFGWGKTWPLLATDAAGLILLGMVQVAWSRRCLGRTFPGLASYLIFLTYYLSLNYELVAQRDWQTSLCIGLALLSLQAWPGRASLAVSAVLTAAALSIRPHAVLFLPALVSAVQEDARPVAPGSRAEGSPAFRRLGMWILLVGGFTAIAFSPLVVAGIADDLVRGLRVAAYGGPYSRADLPTAGRVLLEELREPGSWIAIALLIPVLATTRGPSRRRAVTWTLALAAALSYRLFHPVQHRYLEFPSVLFGTLALMLSFAWIIERVGVPAPLRLILLVAVIGKISLGLPRFCSLSGTAEALRTMARGETLPIQTPPGALTWYETRFARYYPWEDYRNALIYLRERTPRATMVANVLRQPPFPSMNGTTGHISPFLAESGICWMWLVPIDLEPEFAAELERATDSVVVWSPKEGANLWQLKLDQLCAVIRERYRPEARFGRIEVWRRAVGPP